MLNSKKRKTKEKFRRFCVDNFFFFFLNLKKYLFLNDILCINTMIVVRRLKAGRDESKKQKNICFDVQIH